MALCWASRSWVGWQEFLSAEVNVSNEASTLTTMYRQTVAMPQPEQSQMREQLRKYAGAVQGPEWGKQNFDRISNRGRAAITEMYRIVGSQQSSAASSAINQDFLGRLTVLASNRSTRILDAKPRIPSLLWCSLIFGGLVLITLTGFLRLTSTRGHQILTGAVSVLLGLLLYLRPRTRSPFWPTGRHLATFCPRHYGFRRGRQRNVTSEGHRLRRETAGAARVAKDVANMSLTTAAAILGCRSPVTTP